MYDLVVMLATAHNDKRSEEEEEENLSRQTNTT